MVGASGAIAGVMGGYFLLFPRARVDILLILIVYIRVFPVPAWLMLGVWFAIQFASGVSGPVDGNVAYWAHAGGFGLGFLAIVPAWLRAGGTRFWAQTHGHPDHPEARYRLVESSVPRVRRRK
jgi:membrane associated rhomboid family serine protease